MAPRSKKIGLGLLAVVLLIGSSRVQSSLNHDRERLGLTRIQPLENAPPVLAFTTVALGGFRGLISNALWIRASDLQDEDKFFEMAQLADWITKLEPHFVQVWLVQAWNMAYNISVKFKDFPDRWRWVSRGIELLRDEGLKYNPNETLIYRELAWFFQHKIGQDLADANMTYKQQWADEMAKVFDKKKPNLDELINPQTEDQKRRAQLLQEKYKMDPAFMKLVDERHGPLEWRLPEAHAIYWAALGLKTAQENPSRLPKKDDLITLRRVIYQSMQLSFQRGKLIINPFAKAFEFGPNLEIIPKVSAAYEQAAEEDVENRDHILKAHRNFLKDAVYFLYIHNRIADASSWFKYLGTKYPDKPLLDDTNSFPRNVTLDQFAISHVQEDINETSKTRVTSTLEGLLVNSYRSLTIDEGERALGFLRLAQQVWNAYMNKISKDSIPRIGLSPLEDIKAEMLKRLLDPKNGLPPEERAVLRSKLKLPQENPGPQASAAQTAP